MANTDTTDKYIKWGGFPELYHLTEEKHLTEKPKLLHKIDYLEGAKDLNDLMRIVQCLTQEEVNKLNSPTLDDLLRAILYSQENSYHIRITLNLNNPSILDRVKALRITHNHIFILLQHVSKAESMQYIIERSRGDKYNRLKVLERALEYGHVDILRELKITPEDEISNPAFLNTAVRGGQVDSLKFMVAVGVDKYNPYLLKLAINHNKLDVFNYLTEDNPNPIDPALLLDAITVGCECVFIKTILSKGIDLTQIKHGVTILTGATALAFSNRRKDIMRYLMEFTKNPNLLAPYFPSLIRSVVLFRVESEDEIIDMMEFVFNECLPFEEHCNTALLSTFRHNQKKVFRYLTEKGASIKNIPDQVLLMELFGLTASITRHTLDWLLEEGMPMRILSQLLQLAVADNQTNFVDIIEEIQADSVKQEA
jgi:hypothetical protein